MMKFQTYLLPAVLALSLTPAATRADDLAIAGAHMDHGAAAGEGAAPSVPPPATLGWTAQLGAGAFMAGYTPSFGGMAGNYIGADKVSNSTIATTIPSGQTHTMTTSSSMGSMGSMSSMSGSMGGATTTTMPTMLRIVPNNMQMQMQGFNLMYGLSDSLTVMAMGGLIDKSMTMTTYKGMMGSTVLGTSSGSTEGLSDTMIGANYRLYKDEINRVSIGLSLNLPTGSQTRQITMLSPMAVYMLMRAPYMMQSGTGSVGLIPDVVYTGALDRWTWGLAWRGFFNLNNNAEGYRIGDLNEFHGWGGYTLLPGVTTTFHVIGSTQDHIHGSDPEIMGLAQQANPLYYGGQRVTLLGGVSLSGALWGYAKSSLSVEAGGPVYQNLNGPQLGQAWQLTVAARLMF